MRLESFRVEGFGPLADFGRDDLAPGLVVVLGPNEAGKSTLFDFLTGVLFGFPNRRDHPRFHSPLKGGRHGGRLSFVDEAGGHWLVERYAGAQRGLSVRLPDGSAGDEASLSGALAGASASLFEAVFAVGPEELGRMKNLERDEVRELLFAASIFGQRRSAAKVMKDLSEARDDLARPRREDAVANRLAAELERLRRELAGARQEAEQYEALRREAADVEAELQATRARMEVSRERQGEAQILESCWQLHRRAAAAGAELATLPAPGPEASLLAHTEEVRSLAGECSGHLERLAKLTELRRSRASIDDSVERRLSRLGEGWTRRSVAEAPDAQVLGHSVRTARDHLAERVMALRSATAVLAQSDELLAGLPEDDAAEVPGREELEDRMAAAAELRERMAEAEQLQLEALAHERTRPTRPPASSHAVRRPPLALGLGGLLFVALGAAVAGLGGHPTVAVSAWAAGAAFLIAAGLSWLKRLRVARLEDAATGPSGAADDARALERAAMLERARARVDELALALGMSLPASRVDLERQTAGLQREWEHLRQLEEHREDRAQAKIRRDRAAAEAEASACALADEEAAFGQWCRQRGLDPRRPPDALLEDISDLAEIRERLEDLGRVDKAIARLEPGIASFAWRCEELFGALEPELLSGDASRDLAAALSRLVRLSEQAAAAQSRKGALEAEAASASEALELTLGTGATAGRLRSRLATGDVLSWSRERSELERMTDELQRLEELCVRRHEALAEQMRQVATSDRIAQLEQEQSAIEAELDAVLRRYLVLGTARALLQRTLSRHEQERQPAVVAKAAEHFARVTAGRYVRILADAGPEGRRRLRVVTGGGGDGPAGGEVIDAENLSRGTIEQLYLCVRLGLADFFAQRSISLPLVLDDVLVNFDPERARAVAGELAESSRTHQILLFTCHPHLADMVLQAGNHLPGGAQLIRLGRLGEYDRQGEQLPLAALAALPDLEERPAVP